MLIFLYPSYSQGKPQKPPSPMLYKADKGNTLVFEDLGVKMTLHHVKKGERGSEAQLTILFNYKLDANLHGIAALAGQKWSGYTESKEYYCITLITLSMNPEEIELEVLHGE